MKLEYKNFHTYYLEFREKLPRITAYSLVILIGLYPQYSKFIPNEKNLSILSAFFISLVGIFLFYIFKIYDVAFEKKEESIVDNFSKAIPIIHQQLVSSLKQKGDTSICAIGVAMKFSWPFIKNVIDEYLKGDIWNGTLRLKLTYLDENWSDFHKAKEWQKESQITSERIENFIRDENIKELIRQGKLFIEITKYKHMPDRHGLLIDDNILFLSHCKWLISENNLITGFLVGENPYDIYKSGNNEGRIRISEFKSLYKFCTFYNKSDEKRIFARFEEFKIDFENSLSLLLDTENYIEISIIDTSLSKIWPMISNILIKKWKKGQSRSNLILKFCIVDESRSSELGMKIESRMFSDTERTLSHIELFGNGNSDVFIDVFRYQHLPSVFGILLNRKILYKTRIDWKDDAARNTCFLELNDSNVEKFGSNDIYGGDLLIDQFETEVNNCRLSQERSFPWIVN